jgi:hypothetical protein
MAYLGNQPALSYTSFAKQDFTTSATTSYVLDNPVANANELALFINFVRQEPTTAYSASGTSLTLTSATSASDDMYCVFLGKAVQTVNPPNASVGISQLTATGTKDATTFLRGDNTFASAGGDNTPAFSANQGTQSIANSTTTLLTFGTEVLDTDNCYASSKFTPTSSGEYFIRASLRLATATDFTGYKLHLRKNGADIRVHQQSSWHYETAEVSGIINLNGSSDYVEVYVSQNSGGSVDTDGDITYNTFQGFKLIT